LAAEFGWLINCEFQSKLGFVFLSISVLVQTCSYSPVFKSQLLAMLLKLILVKKSIFFWKRVITANNFHLVCWTKGFDCFWLQTFSAVSNFYVKQSWINHQLLFCARNGVKIWNHGIPIELPELRKAPFKRELSMSYIEISKYLSLFN